MEPRRCLSCLNPAVEGRTRCEACAEKNRAKQRIRDKTKRERALQERAARRAAFGLKPVPGRKNAVGLCGNCGEPGHRRVTCPHWSDRRCAEWEDGARCTKAASRPIGARGYCAAHWKRNRQFLRRVREREQAVRR